MNRFKPLAWWVVFPGPVTSLAQEPGPAQKHTTLKWIQALQQSNGGFTDNPQAGSTASLSATLHALRALRDFDGDPKDRVGCRKFVMQCYDTPRGGYAAMPGGKPDCRTTAFGLMAAGELKLPADQYIVRPVIFMCSGGIKKFEDQCLTAAAYEAVQSKCEFAQDWIAAIQGKQNPDGTFGQGPDLASKTALAAITLLRLGGRVDHRDLVIKALQARQLADGGWGKEKSDLETTYHVVQALHRLGGRFDGAACRAFVGKCCHEDGSFGLVPDQRGTLRATYFAGKVLHWLKKNK